MRDENRHMQRDSEPSAKEARIVTERGERGTIQ